MSFLDNARRAFGVRDEEYYDESYEDEEYDEYEDEEPKKSFFSFLKRNEDTYEDAPQPEEKPRYQTSYSSRTTARERYASAFGKTAEPAPARANMSGVEVTVHYPTSLDDATRIIREVKGNRITLFDISGITSDAEARRVVDYIGGAAFGMECPFERLCPSIFCIAPVGVKLDPKKRY